MYSVRRTAALPAVGFPIRTSPDQSLVSGSPTLFAATHVLLRLLSPRHPSCALCSLVISLLAASLPREDQGPARPPWLTGCPPDDTLPTSHACAYAVVKDHSSWGHESALCASSCPQPPLPGDTNRRCAPHHVPVGIILVEPIGIEPTTSSLQSWRSPS